MGFPGETKTDRNARLFKKDLKQWLEGKTGPVPVLKLDDLRTTWGMWNERGNAVLTEIGWQRVIKENNWVLEPIPPPELPESTISINPKPPTVISTPHVPRAGRPGPKPDSDNTAYRLDKDA
jgi:hypothetical protein